MLDLEKVAEARFGRAGCGAWEAVCALGRRAGDGQAGPLLTLCREEFGGDSRGSASVFSVSLSP